MMHYKRKTRIKIHSPSFYLGEEMLEKINFIAEFDSQSRSVIVLRALEYTFNKNWERSKNVYKKKKKVPFEKKHLKKIESTNKENQNEQKSLFEFEFANCH